MSFRVSTVSVLALLSLAGCSGGAGEEAGAPDVLTTDAMRGSGHGGHGGHHAGVRETAIVVWNDTALAAIRASGFGPTIAARALAELHTATFDAWTAYSASATPTLPSVTRRPANERTGANKSAAVSYAAYQVLTDLFPDQESKFRDRLLALGGDPAKSSTDTTTPEGVGTVAARAVIAVRRVDASNQLGDISPGAYSDYTQYEPVNTPDLANDPNRWQPLRVNGKEQVFITPHWQNVTPFSLDDPTAFRPGPPADDTSTEFVRQAERVLRLSADLDDRRKAIAEYWQDGNGTAQSPGHWMRVAQYVSARDRSSIDDDVKLFFALGNAMLDTSIATWDAKRLFDSVRPITAIRTLFAGKMVRAWGGPNKGTRRIDGAEFTPYMPANEVTPASAEYVAEESAFAFAAAEVLRRFTGSDAYGETDVVRARSSRVEVGVTPRRDVRLCWRTFESAARQAGRAGLLRGVHFANGDEAGRKLGAAVGAKAWTAAESFFHDADTSCNRPRTRVANCDGDCEDGD